MSRKFVITEEQYNLALKEGINISADVTSNGGDVKKAVSDARSQALKNGLNLSDVNIQVKGSDVNESRLITKEDLIKERLNTLKENSKVITVKDFLKK